MRLRKFRIWIGAAVFLASALAGFAVARPFAPERLRADLESRLSAQLGGELRIAELRVGVGLGLRLAARGVTLDRPGGAALRVERVTADLRPFANLTGQRHLRLLRLERPTLRIGREEVRLPGDPRAAPVPEGGAPAGSAPDEWLRPLVALEAHARELLSGALAADTLEVRDGALWLSAAGPRAAAPLACEAIQGRLRRSWLGNTRLRLRLRLRDEGGERGSLEIAGDLKRRGALRLSLALADLDLGALGPRLDPDARSAGDLSGRLSGALSYAVPQPGRGQLELDLVARELARRAQGAESAPAAGRFSRAELTGSLAIAPQEVRVHGLRFAAGDLTLEIDAKAERPVQAAAQVELAAALRDAAVADLRRGLAWLPEIRREEAASLLAPLESGAIGLLRLGGSDTLSGWQAFLAGRTRRLPRGFVVDAELADATLRIGASDRLQGLAGRLWWTGDRLEIRDATAQFEGSALPRLDVSLDGVSHLFATRPEARRRRASAPPLPGLRPLWKVLAGGGGGEPTELPPLQLEVERLEHPLFFWPIRHAQATLATVPGGVRVETRGGTLAGAPLAGEVEWLFEPEPRVRARLATGPPEASAAAPAGDPGPWLTARLSVGPVATRHWRHERAAGRLRAEGARLRLEGAEIALAPRGHARANAELDLGRAAAAPFTFDFSLAESDLPDVARALGLPPQFASGRVAAAGALSGRFDPAGGTARSLSGAIDFAARAGTLARALPAVMVMALASEPIQPFARREQVRYERAEARFELAEGWLRTEELTLEGPDLRAIASGGVDLARAPHPLDVEIVLFLFRPVDGVLEKIPVLNYVLLGENRNLLAAHYALKGPWHDPQASLIPHRSFTAGPGSLVFERLPALMRRGIGALDSLFSREDRDPASAAAPAAPAGS
jgi:hypothetical protein